MCNPNALPSRRSCSLHAGISNLWSVNRNAEVIRRLANRYKFSTRLKYSILTWDDARQQLAERASPAEPTKQDHWRRLRSRTTALRSADPEQGGSEDPAKSAQPTGAGTPKLSDEDLDMFDLLQSTYNYTTVDHGPDCRWPALRTSKGCPKLTVCHSYLHRSKLAARETQATPVIRTRSHI
jgi:hypothetical protein